MGVDAGTVVVPTTSVDVGPLVVVVLLSATSLTTDWLVSSTLDASVLDCGATVVKTSAVGFDSVVVASRVVDVMEDGLLAVSLVEGDASAFGVPVDSGLEGDSSVGWETVVGDTDDPLVSREVAGVVMVVEVTVVAVVVVERVPGVMSHADVVSTTAGFSVVAVFVVVASEDVIAVVAG